MNSFNLKLKSFTILELVIVLGFMSIFSGLIYGTLNQLNKGYFDYMNFLFEQENDKVFLNDLFIEYSGCEKIYAEENNLHLIRSNDTTSYLVSNEKIIKKEGNKRFDFNIRCTGIAKEIIDNQLQIYLNIKKGSEIHAIQLPIKVDVSGEINQYFDQELWK